MPMVKLPGGGGIEKEVFVDEGSVAHEGVRVHRKDARDQKISLHNAAGL
jgi:hypothetical protein